MIFTMGFNPVEIEAEEKEEQEEEDEEDPASNTASTPASTPASTSATVSVTVSVTVFMAEETTPPAFCSREPKAVVACSKVWLTLPSGKELWIPLLMVVMTLYPPRPRRS